MAHVFISYSRKDVKTANDLDKKLKDECFDTWIDRSKIRTGQKWWDEIVKAIGDCSAFAIVESTNSAESPVVLRELSVALEMRKPIFPLLLEGDPWPQTKKFHFARSIDELVEALLGTRLFIAHAPQDEAFAAKLANDLKGLDAKVWQSRDITSIRGMLDSSRIMLLVLSPASMELPDIKEQWEAFNNEGKQIIPLLLQRTGVPSKLRESQPYIDFFNQDYNIAFAQLYGLLQTAGIKLKEHEKIAVPPQPQLPLSRYDMSKEAQESIWVSGITLDSFIKDLNVINPNLDIRLLMLALDAKVANETGEWTGVNTSLQATMDDDLKSEELAILKQKFEMWRANQSETLTVEGHWVAWRLFKNQSKLQQIREKAPNIQIKTIAHRLAMGYCIVDPRRDEDGGILTASPYFYKIDYLKSGRSVEPSVAPIFLSNVSPKESDRWWFAQYLEEFECLWENAIPWNPV